MRILRALSLDVVAGAACGALLAEQMSGAHMRSGWWVALLTAVWSIYTGDHLLDARKRPAGPLAYRHSFHREHARALTVALAFTLVTGFAAALTLRPPVRWFGVLLSMAVLTYLASAQGFVFPTLPKEPAAGILYAAGIWGGPIVMSEGSRFWLILAAAFHAIAAILNLTMLGVFEAEPDREQGARSLALRLGAKFTARMVLACGVVAGLASCLIAVLALSPATATTRPAPSSTPAAFLVLAAQILMPVFLLLAHSWSSRKERYRFWGDSIFYLGAFPRLL